MDLATSCYEHACAKYPNNLEIMMGLFNCYVREYSYVKQQQVHGAHDAAFLLLIFILFSIQYVNKVLLLFVSWNSDRSLSKCTRLWVKKGFCSGQFAVFNFRFCYSFLPNLSIVGVSVWLCGCISSLNLLDDFEMQVTFSVGLEWESTLSLEVCLFRLWLSLIRLIRY